MIGGNNFYNVNSGNRIGSGVVYDEPKVEKVQNDEKKDPARAMLNKTPREIYDLLSEYVIGQDDVKRILSVAASNHYKRLYLTYLNNEDRKRGLNIAPPTVKKANVLLIGPTGSGKTHVVTTLARILDVPYASISATSITSTGYIGNDADTVLRSLILNAASMTNSSSSSDVQKQATDGTLRITRSVIERAERGIVFIDEIDKLRKKGNLRSGIDVSGEAVQQSLLTIIEGAVTDVVMGDKHRSSEGVSIDTSNILFILGGAFPAMEDIVLERLHDNGEDVEPGRDIYSYVTDEDLETFGLIPEFIGRIPVVASLRSLTRDDFVRILTEPKDAIVTQYQRLFDIDNAKLRISRDTLNWIADRAVEKKRGARGLRTVMENMLYEALFVTPSLRDYNVTVVVSCKTGEPRTHIECDAADIPLVSDIIRNCPSGEGLTIEISERTVD